MGTSVAHMSVVDDKFLFRLLARAKATRLHIAYKIDFIETPSAGPASDDR